MKKCACKGDFLDKLIQPAVLALLYKKPIHGFVIMKELEKMQIAGLKNIDQSGLYRTLKKLEEAGLLTSEWDVNQNIQPRRIYTITSEGRICLANWEKTLQSYKRDIEGLLGEIALK